MRQAGRYHRHYQALKARHTFMELCKQPELAAQVALGPVEDFDFDVSILFSDLLFPLEGLGMGLRYEGTGPELDWHLDTAADLKRLRPANEALGALEFQKEAVRQTRAALPAHKSLIGFVGGPWTLFTYACQGAHDGSLIEAKKRIPLFDPFCETLVPLLEENIRLQFEGGAELVMLFDTAAGELAPALFRRVVVPHLTRLARRYPGKLGYYSRSTQAAHWDDPLFQGDLLAGLGVDHRWPLAEVLKSRPRGFVQGNFDQALLFADKADFERELRAYLEPLLRLSPVERAGWVCGLGHGVLPKTPEDNVRRFVGLVRETFAKLPG
jgi:uroporphyrinogen decarboxylase